MALTSLTSIKWLLEGKFLVCACVLQYIYTYLYVCILFALVYIYMMHILGDRSIYTFHPGRQRDNGGC